MQQPLPFVEGGLASTQKFTQFDGNTWELVAVFWVVRVLAQEVLDDRQPLAVDLLALRLPPYARRFDVLGQVMIEVGLREAVTGHTGEVGRQSVEDDLGMPVGLLYLSWTLQAPVDVGNPLVSRPRFHPDLRVVPFFLQETLVELKRLFEQLPPHLLHLGNLGQPLVPDSGQHCVHGLAGLAEMPLRPLPLPLGRLEVRLGLLLGASRTKGLPDASRCSDD